jgi:endonuclease-8
MPEGDTIRRAARDLEQALTGRRLERIESRAPHVTAAAERLGLLGRPVARVEPRGKHLLVHFEGGAVLHVHLGLHGRWNFGCASGPRPAAAAVVLVAGGVTAVCLGAPTVELLAPREFGRHPGLARLGPDLLADGFDARQARERLRACGPRAVGEALLDQSVLAGIGNVYKSEVLFSCRVSPLAPVAALDDATLDRVVGEARRLMLRNLGRGPRRTTSPLTSETLRVYRRRGRPCPACGRPIIRIAQGPEARSTYLCPACQPSPQRGPEPSPR